MEVSKRTTEKDKRLYILEIACNKFCCKGKAKMNSVKKLKSCKRVPLRMFIFTEIIK